VRVGEETDLNGLNRFGFLSGKVRDEKENGVDSRCGEEGYCEQVSRFHDRNEQALAVEECRTGSSDEARTPEIPFLEDTDPENRLLASGSLSCKRLLISVGMASGPRPVQESPVTVAGPLRSCTAFRFPPGRQLIVTVPAVTLDVNCVATHPANRVPLRREAMSRSFCAGSQGGADARAGPPGQ